VIPMTDEPGRLAAGSSLEDDRDPECPVAGLAGRGSSKHGVYKHADLNCYIAVGACGITGPQFSGAGDWKFNTPTLLRQVAEPAQASQALNRVRLARGSASMQKNGRHVPAIAPP
jgi:hypothetical protein